MQTKVLKFDRNRKRVKNCPSCGGSNNDGKFSPFVGYDNAGHCHSCGETIFPNSDKKEVVRYELPKREIQFIPREFAAETTKNAHENFFILGIKMFFGANIKPIIKKYGIGTWFDMGLNEWNGGTIFYYIDAQNQIRAGKIMLYNPYTLSRIKEEQNGGERTTSWLHSLFRKTIQRNPEINNTHLSFVATMDMTNCFFGEHLINTDQYRNATICIVESEKTAIIANEFGDFKDIVFIASGGSKSLNSAKFEPLAGRNIIIARDADVIEKCKGSMLQFIQDIEPTPEQAKIAKLEEVEIKYWSAKEVELKALGYNVRFWDDIQDFTGGKKADLADYIVSRVARKVYENLSKEHKKEANEFGFAEKFL